MHRPCYLRPRITIKRPGFRGDPLSKSVKPFDEPPIGFCSRFDAFQSQRAVFPAGTLSILKAPESSVSPIHSPNETGDFDDRDFPVAVVGLSENAAGATDFRMTVVGAFNGDLGYFYNPSVPS